MPVSGRKCGRKKLASTGCSSRLTSLCDNFRLRGDGVLSGNCHFVVGFGLCSDPMPWSEEETTPQDWSPADFAAAVGTTEVVACYKTGPCA